MAAEVFPKRNTVSSDQKRILDGILRVAGVRHAVLATSDGLIMIKSEALKEDAAQRLAAAGTAMSGLGAGLARDFTDSGRPPRQAVLDLDGALVFIRRAGDTASLAVVTDGAADPEALSHALKDALTRIATEYPADR